MVTDFQTTKVYFSSWLPKVCPKLWDAMHDILQREGVSHVFLKDTADIWCRDYMPIQTSTNEMVAYIYRPDYLSTPTMQKYITDTELMVEQIKKEYADVNIIDHPGRRKSFRKILLILLFNSCHPVTEGYIIYV